MHVLTITVTVVAAVLAGAVFAYYLALELAAAFWSDEPYTNPLADVEGEALPPLTEVTVADAGIYLLPGNDGADAVGIIDRPGCWARVWSGVGRGWRQCTAGPTDLDGLCTKHAADLEAVRA